MIKIEELSYKKDVYDLTIENNHNFFVNDILVHNCTEIVEHTRASKLIQTELSYDKNMTPIIDKKYEAGEIALCNLCSLNLYELYNGSMTDDEIYNTIYETLEAMDATFDVQFYPVIEGEYSNNKWRYIGVGFLNYAKLLASEGLKIGSQESKEYTAELMDDVSFKIYTISNELAKSKGMFPAFKETHWAKGKTPIDFANVHALNLTKYKPNYEKWKKLGKSIMEHGMRFALHIAIAPTATSGSAINSTPSIEPIFDYIFKEEGEGSTVTLAPELAKYGKYYVPAFEVNNKDLIELAAIRQIYMDQAQSINLYFQPPFSLKEQTELHFYSHYLGVKTLYYFQTKKDGDDKICESCT